MIHTSFAQISWWLLTEKCVVKRKGYVYNTFQASFIDFFPIQTFHCRLLFKKNFVLQKKKKVQTYIRRKNFHHLHLTFSVRYRKCKLKSIRYEILSDSISIEHEIQFFVVRLGTHIHHFPFQNGFCKNTTYNSWTIAPLRI